MSLTVLQLLPDDVLLEVMQYLSVEDVFACRLVCKRLEALARDPTVWCHRRIDMHRPRAVLRLAPCLGAIVCKAHHESGFQGDPDPAFEATKCAVTSLNFELTAEYVQILKTDEDFPSRLTYFARVVRNQVTLGRLKHVTVQIRQLCGGYWLWLTFSTPRGAADALLDALAQSSCLQSLRFLGWVPSATRPLQRVSSKSSLLLFECWLSKKSESFVKAMLTAHADTLEEVSLFDRGREMGSWGSNDVVASPEITELLARMPRLQRLKYDRLSPIDALAACKTLKDVTLSKTSSGYNAADPPLSKTLKFLSEANELRSLTIHPCYDDNCEELMEAALVSSALSLERLFISGDQYCHATSDSHMKKVQQLLIRTLPRLPALRQLTWNPEWLFQCDELLLAITPLSAPALRRLELISTMDNDRRGSECDHRWLHSAAVRATLAANPLLHIHLRNPQACINYCDSCATLCHLGAGWNFPGRLVLFAHEPSKCPASEDHTAGGREWRSIHMP